MRSKQLYMFIYPLPPHLESPGSPTELTDINVYITRNRLVLTFIVSY